MKLKRLLPILFAAFLSPFAMKAQVTTSSIVGTVKSTDGQVLAGATIKATDVPSGTVYATQTQSNGDFTIPNMRAGGPYKVEVSFVGYNTRTYEGLQLELGTPLRLNAILEDNSKTLEEVKITYQKNAVISPEHMGAVTNISTKELNSLPTINRSIADFARLTPQAVSYSNSADGSSMGVSFAGQNNRYNQFTIDGASANDVFGLAASGTNGGQAGLNPVPLDAIKEVQISLSPYDITQSGFTGGGINAVTKSGTNNFHGSVYGFYQDQSLVGKSVSSGLKLSKFTNETFGASLGGPIIKNKLFFFGDVEKYKLSQPLSFNPAESGSGSKFDETTLSSLRDFVKSNYGFDPGSYNTINRNRNSTSVFARIDWNINEKNKLTLRHSYVDGSDDNISRSAGSITFSNGGYVFNSTTNSSVIELTSNFSSRSSNDLRVTYNRIRDARETPNFPSLSISDGGLTYNIGSEQYSGANSLGQDNFTLTDNYVLYRGKHTITIGTDDEFFNTKNVFLRAFYGNYVYHSIADFEANATAPYSYDVSYSTKGGADKAPASVHAGQFSVYGQDVWNATDKFRLTYGLRIDMPVFFSKPSANNDFNSSVVATSNNVATNQVPKSSLLFAPRVGFNWDVKGDRQTQLRGGVGLFTGRVPFVWISNQYSNTGVESIKYDVSKSAVPTDLRFNYDPKDAHLGAYIPANPNSAPSEIDVTSRHFKYPQVLRANLAVDQKLPWWNLIGTVEGTFTKTINNINYKDINLAPSTGTLTLGNTTRPLYSGARIDPNFSNVILLENTSKGYSYTFTAQLEKPVTKGWAGSIAYTYGHSYSLNDGTSSQAVSNWRYAYNINGLNNLDLTRSNFDLGSRIIGHVSKTFNYGIFSTTLGLVYEGRSGLPLSYVYYYDLNGDDYSSADLMYIPTDASQFVPTKKQADAGLTNTDVYNMFKDYINSEKYLKDNQGKNTARNADRLPWESHFDLKIEEGVKLYKMNRLSVSLNIQNAANLLNKKWGHAYYVSNQEVQPLDVVKSGVASPTFTYDPAYGLNTVDGKQKVYNYSDFTSRWRMLLGLRYSF
ncbi:MAG TPA: TonB-dependent receptor [Hanamia sp.]|nr:TonB-dependent receptor [Hanamia sp.]